MVLNRQVIRARGLTKVYRSYSNPWLRILEAVSGSSFHSEHRALDGIDFDISQGQGLALVGENGAGKSTLLKILAGITAPTAGTVERRGKVASILELGSGFHPEFTGRQNIVLNAAMLGLDEAEVRAKTPEIIAFSEIGDFIDQPVKTYSTGMAMRLGFAIATQVDPDILIIDEALSVGDGYFQKKCMDRMGEFVAEGGTLLFCSHAMYYVSHFCRRGLWLREGRMEALGPVEEVVQEYEAFLASKREAQKVKSHPQTVSPPTAERPARFTAVGIHGGTGRPPVFRHGDPLEMEIRIHAQSPDLPLHVGVGIDRSDGVEVTAMATHLDGLDFLSGARDYLLHLTLPRLPLVKGDYSFHAFLLDEKGLHIYDEWVDPTAFEVKSADYRFGLVEVDHSWEIGAAGKAASDTVEDPEPEATKAGTLCRTSGGVSSGNF